MFAVPGNFLRLTPLSYRQGCLSMQLWQYWLIAESYYTELFQQMPIRIKPRVRSWADGDNILVTLQFNRRLLQLAAIRWPRQTRSDRHPMYDVPKVELRYDRLIPRKVNHASKSAS